MPGLCLGNAVFNGDCDASQPTLAIASNQTPGARCQDSRRHFPFTGLETAWNCHFAQAEHQRAALAGTESPPFVCEHVRALDLRAPVSGRGGGGDSLRRDACNDLNALLGDVVAE